MTTETMNTIAEDIREQLRECLDGETNKNIRDDFLHLINKTDREVVLYTALVGNNKAHYNRFGSVPSDSDRAEYLKILEMFIRDGAIRDVEMYQKFVDEFFIIPEKFRKSPQRQC